MIPKSGNRFSDRIMRKQKGFCGQLGLIGLLALEDLFKPLVSLCHTGCFFLKLAEEGLQRLVQGDRLVELGAGAGPVGPPPDQLLHVRIGRHHLGRPVDRRQIGCLRRPRHGAGDRFEDVDGRIAPALGNGALHDDMAVEDAAHGIRHRLVMVVAVHQHAENAGDGALLGARPGPFEQARQLGEYGRRIALGGRRLASREPDLALRHGKAGDRIHQHQHIFAEVAEYFRDLGKDVLVLMDSVTRFAMAQRAIGLSAGEPPTAKGYTPTVFTELPRLLERAGPGTEQGTITGIFSVLVDGDDHNEPVADAVRGILDGHIVMERAIAERGRYPAINILKSISRTMPRAAEAAYLPAINRAPQVMATYADMEELIRRGADRTGSSAEFDEAIALHKPLEAFLSQLKEESTSMAEGYQRLEQILQGQQPDQA